MSDAEIRIEGLTKFKMSLLKAGRLDFAKAIEEWLQAIGVDFLRVVRDEVIRLEVVDTRALLNSFKKRRKTNVFKKLDKGLGLEIGTNLEYASFVNTGHKLRNGEWWEGYHYFDNAKIIYENILNKALEKKMEKWLNKYFNEFK